MCSVDIGAVIWSSVPIGATGKNPALPKKTATPFVRVVFASFISQTGYWDLFAVDLPRETSVNGTDIGTALP